MASYIEHAKAKGYNLNRVMRTLRGVGEGDEVTVYGIRVIRESCCFSCWSSRGMMRLGRDLDKAPLAIMLLTLATVLKGDNADE